LIQHTSVIIGKNSLAGWNRLTSLPYEEEKEIHTMKASKKFKLWG